MIIINIDGIQYFKHKLKKTNWTSKRDLEFFMCPLCGGPLSMDLCEDSEGKFVIEFFCEGEGDDRFNFEIRTGLSNRDIANFKEGVLTKREMLVKITERIEEKRR